MIPHDHILPIAIEKTRSRDKDYGLTSLTTGGFTEAWETIPISAVVAGIEYKVQRAIQPGTSFEKAKDDIEDAYNYVAVLYERIIREHDAQKEQQV